MPTLYVNATGGDDSRDYTTAQTESTPWATIQRAVRGNATYAGTPSAGDQAAAAQAGDTVLVAAGVYTANGDNTYSGSESRFHVALNPANSGTSGNPITIRGVGTVEIRCDTSLYGPTIGSNGRDYIIWDNFVLDGYYQGNQTDDGSAFDHGQVSFDNADHCQIINSDLYGHNGSHANGRATSTGNHSVVWLGDGTGCIVKNNTIHRVWGTGSSVGSGGQNDAGVLTYGANSAIIEHNEVYDCGCGIFIKGTPSGMTQTFNTVRYNELYENFLGIEVLDAEDTKVYQNVVYDAVAAEGACGLYIGFGDSLRTKWINNTVYNCGRGIFINEQNGVIDVEVHNNIVASSTVAAVYAYLSASPSASDITFTRNWYHDSDTHASWESAGQNYTFNTWQTTYSHDANGSDGVSPSFTDAANGDFRIANATALVTGRVVESIGGTNGDTIPVGAYISSGQTEEIGIEASPGGSSGTMALFLA